MDEALERWRGCTRKVSYETLSKANKMVRAVTPAQRYILRHLQARPDRMAYKVGWSPEYDNIGRWTASYPQPRIWFASEDVEALRRSGHLIPWRGLDEALVPARH